MSDSPALRDVAVAYCKAGWFPLELPERAKAPPPDGRTGYGGSDMTLEEINLGAWVGNIGLRMPTDVVGLDVDAYRNGAETLKRLLARCGELPNTWISHSGRGDGSGIRFYRAPPGLVWIAGLAGMDVIQRTHRYAVVYPSIHPDGRPYGWVDQTEGLATAGELPAVEQLPELPWAWIAELSRAQQSDVDARPHAADHAELTAFVATHTQADQPSYIGTICDHFVERTRAGYSRHDSMQHALLWALECVAAGVAAAAPTLDALARLWTEALGSDARRAELVSARRTTEWEAMVRHAVGKVSAKPLAEILRIHDDIAGVPMRPAPPEPSPVVSVPVSDRFQRYSVAELLAADRTFHWDVVGMLAQHTYGLDAGELKTLKSYFGLARDVGLAAGVPILGRWDVPVRRRVLVFVAEGGRIPYTNRLERMATAHGIAPGALDGWLAVIDDVAPMNEALFRDALTFHLRDFGPALVHLDPLYPFQPADVSPNQYTEVGRMLTATHRLCAEHGATFWVTAHMNQSGAGFDLKRVSGAGHGEWGDSWALLRHRDQPDVDAGKFRLGLALGSRQWGGTTWDLDLDIGRFDPELGLHDGPIGWNIRAAAMPPTADDPEDQLAMVKVEMLRAGRAARRPLTRASWLIRVKRRDQLKRVAFDELIESGQIVQIGVGKPAMYEVLNVP